MTNFEKSDMGPKLKIDVYLKPVITYYETDRYDNVRVLYKDIHQLWPELDMRRISELMTVFHYAGLVERISNKPCIMIWKGITHAQAHLLQHLNMDACMDKFERFSEEQHNVRYLINWIYQFARLRTVSLSWFRHTILPINLTLKRFSVSMLRVMHELKLIKLYNKRFRWISNWKPLPEPTQPSPSPPCLPRPLSPLIYICSEVDNNDLTQSPLPPRKTMTNLIKCFDTHGIIPRHSIFH